MCNLAKSRMQVLFIWSWLGLGFMLELGLVIGLRFGLVIPTCHANLVLRVISQCDIFGMTPVSQLHPAGNKLYRQMVKCGPAV